MTSAARTPAVKRRWQEAHASVKRASIVSWPLAVSAARAMDEKQLVAAAQGCTDLTCVRHGAVNEVRRERGLILTAGEVA